MWKKGRANKGGEFEGEDLVDTVHKIVSKFSCSSDNDFNISSSFRE